MHPGWEFTTSHQKDAGTFILRLVSEFTPPGTLVIRKQKKSKGWLNISHSEQYSCESVTLCGPSTFLLPHNKIKIKYLEGLLMAFWGLVFMQVCLSPYDPVYITQNHSDIGCTHSLCWAWGNARWASRCSWLLCYEETLGRLLTVCSHGAWWA